MKKTVLQIVILVAVVGLVWGAVEWSGAGKKDSSSSAVTSSALVTASNTNRINNPGADHPSPLMATNEWSQFINVRQTALKANPDLADEYKQIMKKMDAQQGKMDAAMFKADPKVKPVIAKLVALRQKNNALSAGAGVAGKPEIPSGLPVTLTQDDMQELRIARTAAIKSNPDLLPGNKAIGDQMRDYQTKLDAAMIKIDPSVAPLIAKFQNGRRVTPNPAMPSRPDK